MKKPACASKLMIRDFMVDWFSWIQTFVKKKKKNNFGLIFVKNDYFGNTRDYHNRSLLPMNSILKLLESWSFNAGNTDLTLTFFLLPLTGLVPIGAQVCMKPHLSFMRYFLQVVKGQLISECLFDFLNFPKNHWKIWQISAEKQKRC